jgi:hypothetical protein
VFFLQNGHWRTCSESSLSPALPPLAFLFGVDLVCKRSESRQRADFVEKLFAASANSQKVENYSPITKNGR